MKINIYSKTSLEIGAEPFKGFFYIEGWGTMHVYFFNS